MGIYGLLNALWRLINGIGIRLMAQQICKQTDGFTSCECSKIIGIAPRSTSEMEATFTTWKAFCGIWIQILRQAFKLLALWDLSKYVELRLKVKGETFATHWLQTESAFKSILLGKSLCFGEANACKSCGALSAKREFNSSNLSKSIVRNRWEPKEIVPHTAFEFNFTRNAWHKFYKFKFVSRFKSFQSFNIFCTD